MQQLIPTNVSRKRQLCSPCPSPVGPPCSLHTWHCVPLASSQENLKMAVFLKDSPALKASHPATSASFSAEHLSISGPGEWCWRSCKLGLPVIWSLLLVEVGGSEAGLGLVGPTRRHYTPPIRSYTLQPAPPSCPPCPTMRNRQKRTELRDSQKQPFVALLTAQTDTNPHSTTIVSF